MKALNLIVFLFCCGAVFSQAPQKINYQGVARNSSGTALANTNISFTIGINNSSGGYSETQSVISNAVGIFALQIGNGSPLSGSFAGIDWSASPTNLNVTMDDGTGPVSFGPQQLISVPYALYAEKAGSAPSPAVGFSGGVLTVGTNSVLIPASSYTAGTGIAIGSGTITNTAPDQVVTINPGINVSVSGSYPSFSVSSTPTLALSGNSISISGGNTIVLPSASSGSYVAGNGIAITSGSIINTQPNQTVNISGTSVSGSYPNYTIASATSYTAGNGIAITSGSIINTQPNQTVNISGTGGTSVSGSYPNYTIASPASYTAGSGIAITSGSIINTQPNQTVNISGTSVSGTYPNYTIASAAATSVTAGNSNISVTGSSPNYTISSSPLLNLATNTLSISNGNSVNLPSYSPGNGLSLTGSSPNFTLGASTSGTNSIWSSLGNSGTNSSLNFIGTTDPVDLNFRTNNVNRVLINSSGQFGVGHNMATTPANALLHFAKAGAFDTRLVLSGGDNSNNYGALISLGENLNSGTQGITIKMDAVWNRLLFVNDFTGGGSPVVSIGGYSGSNNGMTIGTSYWFQNPPTDGLLVQGNVGIGTTSPATALHVNGPVTITDGSQNQGYVLTSNASGTGTWQKPVIYSAPGVSILSLGNVNTTPTMFSPTMPFTKQYPNTVIEVMCTLDMSVASMTANGVVIEMKIDGLSSIGNAKTVYFPSSLGVQENVTIIGVFTGLSAGAHNVQFYASAQPSGTATNVTLNSGGWVPQLIIKEN